MQQPHSPSLGSLQRRYKLLYALCLSTQAIPVPFQFMGGFHTAYISLHYPNTFDYVGLFSSALNVNPGGNNLSNPAYQDVDEKLKRQMNNGYKLYWIGVGADDVTVYQGIQDYRKKMDSIGMKYEYFETDGGHTWQNWRKYLVDFAQKIFK